jgi:ketosteroid isomerase-like protein
MSGRPSPAGYWSAVSQENVELIRRGVGLANESDDHQAVEAAVAELYHPDVELRDLQHPPDVPEVVRGRAAVVAGLQKWMELFDDWSVEVYEYIDADPWVVCDTHWRATGKGSDVPIDWRVADAHEVKDGKIVREIYGFPDVAAALEAVRAEGADVVGFRR